ncbi:MAG: phosphoribosylformylglycinamidine synthase subunit PurL, partial [Bdellovibrionales bacterium]|nr:phosphoribosylformylglycinamidine synthase subunit PurL [Bdellovibrionales bacterium]
MTRELLEKRLKHYRLTSGEYKKICGLLGHEPEGIEWALFSALWSEHCSYKSSRRHLKKFFFKSPRVLESFGENAGVVDLGQGERIAFKMESHNHPSYIEPFQGAATGVGGILRDIFTMGARPIVLGDYLCFGDPKASRMNALVDGVVRGISHYGNCVGVPTITGQTEFHSSYDGNILVNAFALGLFRPGEPIVTSKAKGPGNWVVYVGAKTGKDGVHGASMASESFDEESESKKPTVQIGDPFFEKLLIEPCIEVMRQQLVVAIQDMGAAGLTSSSFEMASKGQVGLDLYLDEVPLRDSSITPEEILLSESQERMLLVCEPEKFEELAKVFHQWGLDAVKIGNVREERKVNLYWKSELLTSIDPDLLTENAPIYDRTHHVWQSKHEVSSFSNTHILNEKDLLQVLSLAEGCSRDWIYHQYDQRVGGMTHRDATNSVSVVRLPDSGRALAVVLGCRPQMMRTDVFEGAKDAAFAPAIDLAIKGFEPLALTDCLNFGNPEKPELMTELVASIEGLAEATHALKAPIISGNVS